MSNQNFLFWLEQFQQQALANGQRQLVLLVGSACWVKKLLAFDEKTESSDWLIYSNHNEILANIKTKNIARQLGSENKKIFFSCSENKNTSDDHSFKFDAFSALSGTLVAGGVMFIWLDAEQEATLKQKINSTAALSLTYFYHQLLNYDYLPIIKQSEPQILPSLVSELFQNNQTSEKVNAEHLLYLCKTPEQQSAVEQIINVSQGHRNRPLVLTADRGRGKSSALAIACAQLLENNDVLGHEKINIIVTAPHLRSLSVFYRQLALSLSQFCTDFEYTNADKTALKHTYGTVTFVAADQLLQPDKTVKASLLLVDEAAAIPVPLLTQLTQRYSRIVFASTVHGYEGAGRGFTLKFQQQLAQLMPQWRSLHLQQPIRWCEHDPLERFVFNSCLLNACLAELPKLASTAEVNNVKASLTFSEIPTVSLLKNQQLFEQVFSVLVTAHYQTSPNDISLILDNPASHLLIASAENNIVGVALLLAEGCDNEEKIKAITTNKRRLKNQFIPQSLLTHCGFSDSFNYQYLRIMRIAIHPQYHGYGFGQQFMGYLRVFAKQQQVDFIGASFGANAKLLSFWQSAGYQIARIGFTKDNASGEHSALVVSAISDRGQFFERNIVSEFYRNFDYLLTDEFQNLSARLVWQILHYCPANCLPKLTTHQLKSIGDFSGETRQFSCCVLALHHWLLLHCQEEYQDQVLILIERVLQKKSFNSVCHRYSLTGKKMLNNTLIDYIKMNN
jgi:tRNA(Met) cytidine acetyltransferase